MRPRGLWRPLVWKDPRLVFPVIGLYFISDDARVTTTVLYQEARLGRVGSGAELLACITPTGIASPWAGSAVGCPDMGFPQSLAHCPSQVSVQRCPLGCGLVQRPHQM